MLDFAFVKLCLVKSFSTFSLSKACIHLFSNCLIARSRLKMLNLIALKGHLQEILL